MKVFAVDYSGIAHKDLLRACADSGTAAAWEEFIRRFNPVITQVTIRMAARFGESRFVVDDLIQETYLKICSQGCKLLKNVELDDPQAIFGFLKVVTANVVHDHFKARHARKRGFGQKFEEIDEATNPSSCKASAGSPEYIERQVLIRQIDQRLSSSLPPSEAKRDRIVFWLYYRSGLTATAIAAMPSIGLTTKGVESLLHRLTYLVRETLMDQKLNDLSKPQKGIKQAESF